MSTQSPFADHPFGAPISSYTRTQAIEDGQQHDVTESARPYGLSRGTSMCITDALWESLRLSDSRAFEDFMRYLFVRLRQARGGAQLSFGFAKYHGGTEQVYVEIGPFCFDDPHPTLTVMTSFDL